MNKKHNRFRSNMSREQFDQLQGTEIKSKRTRFGKVFALGANRFQAVTYTDPVHRFNEKTHEWDEMDNRFSATPRMKEAKAAWQQGIMPTVAHGDVLLECKTGSMDVACAMSGEAPFINLTDAEGRHLAWGIRDAMSILPEAEDIHDTPAQNVRGMREKVLDHLHGEVAYNGIFAGVDLRCKLDRGFKDELVFAEKASVRPITFLLESEGRQMELNEQNMLVVKDEQGEAVFRLQAPFMLDANEQRGEVAVQLEACEGGMYAMTYIPDEAFIENAAFPVVLDPAIESVRGESGIVDTYVKEGSTTLYNTADQVWVCNNTTYGKRYGYMRVVDLPKIDANHFITGAFLNLKNYSAPTAETAMMCSEVLGDWDAATLTFATQPEVNPLYQDYCKFPASKYTWQTLDVTTLARKWYLGDNKGVMFTPRSESPNTIRIQSSDGSAKPYFTVNYASLAGLEGYLTYDSQSAGLAGSGSVSLVNGNLIFAHGDTAMDGNRMPVSITHYYNSCNSDVDEFGLGYGWRTSVHQTLHKEYINEEVVYVYTDGDGTEHWFEVDEDDSTQYVDMSGLNLTLTVGEDGKITITSKGDGRMVFPEITDTPTADAPTTDKVLIENIHDAVNSKIVVTARTDYPLYVDTVMDGAERTTTFVYATQPDGSLKCTAIKTPWQSDTACTRFAYEDGFLITITHEDNRVSTYLYEDRNDYQLLIQAQGTDGLAVRYEYSNTGATYGLPHCITYAETGETAILSSDASVKNAALYAAKVTYSYGNHLTLVTDNISGNTLRYHFNDNGNQISIDDGLGYAVYTEYDQSDDNANAPINHATTRSRMQRTVKNLLLDPMIEEDSSVWEKSSTGTFTRDQTTNQWGLVSYKVKVPADGEAYVRQAVTLKPGQPYTLSAYMKSAAPKALVRAAYTINGETKYFTSDAVPVDANASDGDFKRVSVSFTLPASADATVYCEAMQYGNGTVVKNEYDDFNRVTGVVYGTKSENAETATFEDNPRYEYAYNANGQVAHVRNNLIGQIAESEYDLSNRPCRIKTHKFAEDAAGNVTSQEHVYTGEVAYDDVFGRLSKFTEQVGEDHEEFVTTFGYDDENRPTSLEYGDYGESTLEYDGLGRVANATVKAGGGTANTTTYTYVAGAELEDVTDKTSTTGLVESISQTGGNFTYTYDDNGNIISVVQDGVTTSYTYDALGQLVRVVDGQEGATWEYAYDQGGNILSKKKFVDGVETESMSFEYTNENWRDQLTKVNDKTITYDKIGNPLSDGTWTYTWQNGRQLQKMQKSGETVEFIYNENGLRVQKTATSTGVTKYTLHGKNVVHMTQGSNELHFFYNAQNKPTVVVFNGVPYTYVKNLQSDVVAILDKSNNVVVNYFYDVWGQPIGCSGIMADTLGRINPFRYRGYIYDNETSMYSLCYRYYNSALNRFINADDRICISNKLTFTNAYSYCCGTPVNTKDSSGTDAIWLLSGAGCTHVSLLIQDENGTWYYYFWGANHPNWGGSVFYAGSSALVGSGGSSASSGGSSASSGGSSVSSGSVVGSVGVGSDVAATGGNLIYVECPFDFSPTTLKSEILSATSCTYAADGKPVANEHTYYEGVYTQAYYISGDFTASHNLISSGGWPIGSYDLLENNCVQTSIDLLMASKDANPQWGALLKQLDGLRTLVHPGLITELADLPDILPQ